MIPLLWLLLAVCSYVAAAFGPNLPVMTAADTRRVGVSYDQSGGLRSGDLLLLVNDRSADAWSDDGVLSLDEASAQYRVTVVRDGRSLTFTVAAQGVPLRHIVLRWGGPLLLLLASLFVVALFGVLGNDSPPERGIRIAFLGIASNLIILPLLNIPPLNWIIEPLSGPAQVIAIGMISGSFIFFMGYPQPSRFWHPRWLPLGVYSGTIGSGLLLLLLGSSALVEPSIFSTERIITIMAMLIAVVATLLSVRAYRRTSEASARAQLRWIAWGLLIGVPPWIGLFAIPSLVGAGNSLLYAIALLPMLAVPLSFTLAVLRFRLLDVDEVLNRSLVYVLLSLALGGIYAVIITLLSWAITPLAGGQANGIISFLTTLAIATIFNPALRTARHFVNGIFYRERHDLLRHIRAAARDLRGVEGWSALLPLLGRELPTRLQVEQGMLLLFEEGRYLGYDRAGAAVAMKLPADWHIERPLVLQNWEQEDGRTWAQPLLERGFQLAFILVAGGRSVGMYALGSQQSGGWYDRQSIAALNELADRIAGAIENARLLEQSSAQASLRYELAVARRIQESLLPATQLVHGPLDVAAINLSASDVGGDLYALHQRDGTGLTIAVGDVSGKGVPAALMMAVTSAVLTTVSAEECAPGSVLRRVNRQLKDYTTQNRQNVALCFVSLTPIATNGNDMPSGYLLEAANAGAIPPLLRHANGATEWLEIGGLPLGSPLPGDPYTVEQRTLYPGDTLLLCTDGLLEAQSADGALLSFDGVADVLARAPASANAQTILDRILLALGVFTDGHEAQDDVTVVVLRVRE